MRRAAVRSPGRWWPPRSCFPCGWSETGLDGRLRGLNDSKQLTEAQREEYYAILTSHPEIRWAVASVDVEVIDRINILQATHRAMNLALAQLQPPPEHVLVDGRPVKSMRFPHTALVKGDARSYSIAGASVLAKVTRDRLMREFDRLYPGYGFAEHKGYGTPAAPGRHPGAGPLPDPPPQLCSVPAGGDGVAVFALGQPGMTAVAVPRP